MSTKKFSTMNPILHTLCCVIFMLTASVLAVCSAGAADADTKRPNIVFIIADDLGYGDLGCYGQQKIKTPVIDSLAKEGVRFTRHYSGNNVCAPSRAVLMTGMHPGHCVIRDNRELQPEGQLPMPEGTITLVGELKKRGYTTGAFGKWGLGPPDSVSAPLRVGFDRFYGYNCQREAHSYYPKELWDNDKKFVVNENPTPGRALFAEGIDTNDPTSYDQFKGENYSADLITEQVLRFAESCIENEHGKPFFLFWPTTVPHLPLQVPDEYVKEYQGLWDDPPYPGGRGYTPQFAPRAAYAAMVTQMDKSICRLIDLLKERGAYENTLIVFTSDNGPLFNKLAGTDTEFFNSHAGFRGRKGDMHEGGLIVPCVVTWSGKIVPGTIINRVTGFEDWMPTLLDIVDGNSAGVKRDISEKRPNWDGISFAPTLLGKEKQPERPFLYRESPGFEAQQMIIAGDWKAVRVDLAKAKKAGKTLDQVPVELYNLVADPFETNDLSAEYPEKVKALVDMMYKQHEANSDFPMPLIDP